MSIIVCYARCWQCSLTENCPGGWHTWADPDDIEWALAQGKPDPSSSKCGCPCADGPVLDLGHEGEPDYDSIDATPCPVCQADGACGFDNDDRPWIHVIVEDES